MVPVRSGPARFGSVRASQFRSGSARLGLCNTWQDPGATFPGLVNETFPLLFFFVFKASQKVPGIHEAPYFGGSQTCTATFMRSTRAPNQRRHSGLTDAQVLWCRHLQGQNDFCKLSLPTTATRFLNRSRTLPSNQRTSTTWWKEYVKGDFSLGAHMICARDAAMSPEPTLEALSYPITPLPTLSPVLQYGRLDLLEGFFHYIQIPENAQRELQEIQCYLAPPVFLLRFLPQTQSNRPSIDHRKSQLIFLQIVGWVVVNTSLTTETRGPIRSVGSPTITK